MGTDITSSGQIDQLAARIRRVLDENNNPTRNEAALAAVGVACSQIGQHNAKAGHYARRLAAKAEIFYSPRPHTNFAGGTSALALEMRSLLQGIEHIATLLRAEGR